MRNFRENLDIASKNKEKDFIKKYLYEEDIDGKLIPNWMFAPKIATAENMDECCVIEAAKNLGYKVFCVFAYPTFEKNIIAPKEVNSTEIFDEYASYLQGNAKVIDITK